MHVVQWSHKGNHPHDIVWSRHCFMHLIAINESQLQLLNHAPGIRPVTSCLDLEDRLESCTLSIAQGFLTIAGVPW